MPLHESYRYLFSRNSVSQIDQLVGPALTSLSAQSKLKLRSRIRDQHILTRCLPPWIPAGVLAPFRPCSLHLHLPVRVAPAIVQFPSTATTRPCLHRQPTCLNRESAVRLPTKDKHAPLSTPHLVPIRAPPFYRTIHDQQSPTLFLTMVRDGIRH